MTSYHEKSGPPLNPLVISRRRFLRLSLSAVFYAPAFLLPAQAFVNPDMGRDLLSQYLGEQLRYQIGFWLFSHCGEASVSLCKTSSKNIYVATMEGKTVGLVDLLLGNYRYSYSSYAGYDESADRLYPLFFSLRKKRRNKVSIRTVTFNYKDKELILARQNSNGERGYKITGMKKGALYEDYLTLFYNFRHGYYGPFKTGKTYHLPLHIHEGFQYLDLTLASEQERQKALAQELDSTNKDYLVRFRVLKEDVSSKSGKIIGWLSKNGVPIKGIIKDVIFFGDLWGILVKREFGEKFCKPQLSNGLITEGVSC